MASIQKVIKYGNSSAVVINPEVLEQMGLKPGMHVSVDFIEGAIRIRGVEMVPTLSPKDKNFAQELFEKRKGVFEKLSKL